MKNRKPFEKAQKITEILKAYNVKDYEWIKQVNMPALYYIG
ncbi:MAG TPA: hypothetical protein VNJ07_03175 [Chitinophagales bacterium]|nr:hypothetical protein [Chitinophagales bacterium]